MARIAIALRHDRWGVWDRVYGVEVTGLVHIEWRLVADVDIFILESSKLIG